MAKLKAINVELGNWVLKYGTTSIIVTRVQKGDSSTPRRREEIENLEKAFLRTNNPNSPIHWGSQTGQ